jgi:hypothetical protein
MNYGPGGTVKQWIPHLRLQPVAHPYCRRRAGMSYILIP